MNLLDVVISFVQFIEKSLSLEGHYF